MVREFKNWGENFKIEFNIKITKQPGDYINVIHFTANGNGLVYGDRIPAVYIRGGKVYFFSAINGNFNHNYQFDYQLKHMYHIIIKQYKGKGYNGLAYWFEIIIDGESKFKIQNTQQKSFPNVKFYASDPWYDPFSSEFGCFGNITISK